MGWRFEGKDRIVYGQGIEYACLLGGEGGIYDEINRE